MSIGPAGPPWEFSRHHVPAQSDNHTRIVAVLLTGILYAVFALLICLSFNHVLVPTQPTMEITASLVPNASNKRVLEPLPPFLAHLVKPRAEEPVPPVFTIASGSSPQAPRRLRPRRQKPLPCWAARLEWPGPTRFRHWHRRQWRHIGGLL